MRKGFTLIELLAVIVILAIIALIATPIILGIIEDSRRQSAIDSAELYVDGLSKYIANKNLTTEFFPNNCVVGDTVACDNVPIDYKVSGEKPKSGYINYADGVVTDYNVCVMKYKVVKQNGNITATKSDECSGGSVPEEPVIVYDGNGPSDELEGCGTEDGPYLIQSPNDLIYMRDQVNVGGNISAPTCTGTKVDKAADAHYKQTVNIALNNITNASSWDETTTGLYTWVPIGTETNYFNGYYDGDNHSINGIYSISGGNTAGLFGYVLNAGITNLTVDKSYVKGFYASAFVAYSMEDGAVSISRSTSNVRLNGSNLGGFIGESYSDTVSISNSHNSNNFAGTHAGGLIGEAYGGTTTISNCYNTGAMAGGDDGAGLISYVMNTTVSISNSYNTGTVTGHEIGGLIGYAISSGTTITNSYNTGTVGTSDSIGTYAGGFVGRMTRQSYTISQSYNSGNIMNATYVGGFVGWIDQGSLTITESYNTGNISDGTYGVGGLVALANNGGLTITDSYNVGNLSATSSGNTLYLGGIVAWPSGPQIRRTYNTGNIIASSGSVRAGGIAGYASGTITNSYNVGNVNITADSTEVYSSVGGVVGNGIGVKEANVNTGSVTLNAPYGVSAALFADRPGSSTGNSYINTILLHGYQYLEFDSSTYHLTTDDTGVTTFASNEVPTILSVVNGENKFKEDTNNINDGNPILSWQ